MQAGVEPENLERTAISAKATYLQRLTSSRRKEVEMEDADAENATHSDSDTRILTRAQRKRRREEKSPENRSYVSTDRILKAKNASNKQPAITEIEETQNDGPQLVETRQITVPGAFIGREGPGIENAVKKAQEKARLEAKKKDALWSSIAKELDEIIARVAPGQVQEYQAQNIADAILDCSLSKDELKEKKRLSCTDVPRGKDCSCQSESQAGSPQPQGPAVLPNKPDTWAKVANNNSNNGSSVKFAKPSLSQPLRGARPDERLMVRLSDDSPHRKEHPFLLQKRANSVLPKDVMISKVAHIASGLALIPAPGTSILQLEEHNEKLARAFGACRAERNEKWAKYLVRGVPRRINTLCFCIANSCMRPLHFCPRVDSSLSGLRAASIVDVTHRTEHCLVC